MEFMCSSEKHYYNNPRPMALTLDSNLKIREIIFTCVLYVRTFLIFYNTNYNC